jgi:hypothetical protein
VQIAFNAVSRVPKTITPVVDLPIEDAVLPTTITMDVQQPSTSGEDFDTVERRNLDMKYQSEVDAFRAALNSGQIGNEGLKIMTEHFAKFRDENGYEKGFVALPDTPVNKKNEKQRRMAFKPVRKAGEGGVGRPPKEKRAATVNNVLSKITQSKIAKL